MCIRDRYDPDSFDTKIKENNIIIIDKNEDSMNFKDFEYTKGNLEMPISVGFEFLSILSIFAGPSLQYQISDTIESAVFVKEIENKTGKKISIDRD